MHQRRVDFDVREVRDRVARKAWSLDRLPMLVGSMFMGLSGCKPTHAPSDGCGKDVDCKGDRICIDGACVAPPSAEEVKPDLAASPEPRPTAGQGERWFRGGPGHAGATSAVGPKDEPTPLWTLELGAVVFATPTLAEGPKGLTAYVGTHAGRFVGVVLDGEQGGAIDLDVDLGGRIWATAAASEAESPDDLRLYVGNDDDTLFALSPAAAAEAGDPIAWRQRLGNCEDTRSPGPEGARCDVDGGPTLMPGGDLLVGADGVYRLTPEGETRWRWPAPEDVERPKHVFSTPVLSGERVFFGGQDGFVTALKAANGEQLWQHAVRADVDGSGVVGPDGELFIGADDGRLYALRSDGSLRWSFVAQRDIRSSIGIAADGTLYATSFDRNLYSIAASGEVNWVLPTGAPIHSSPVVDGDGTVFFGSQDDHLYAVSAKGEVLWALDVGADIDSSVAISTNGALVIGCDDGTLRAFGPPAGR